jgi:hypothetical protein
MHALVDLQRVARTRYLHLHAEGELGRCYNVTLLAVLGRRPAGIYYEILTSLQYSTTTY